MNYKISELAKLAGISTRTLRHYDDIGLLVPIRIKDSNYRIYDETSVNQLQHILIQPSPPWPYPLNFRI